MTQEYATPENELGYEPDLHIDGTLKKHDSLTFWLSNPAFRAGYDKINWGKQEENEGN